MKKLKVLSVLFFIMLCFLFVSGCDFSVKAEIESVQIKVSGFEEDASEIEVALEERQGLSLSVYITWRENDNKSKELDVIWAFIGDNLGCDVYAIDPG